LLSSPVAASSPHCTRASAAAAGWAELADLGAVAQPVLGLHGADDPVSPLAAARAQYAAAARAEFVTIAEGRHDALNDLTHRSVAATIVLFLERLRLGAELPRIADTEILGRGSQPDAEQDSYYLDRKT
jgi:alpha-beta hydrolase superfamily lysophospholipase